MMETRAVIYARVSTIGQDYQRQLAELKAYASKMNYKVVKEFTEKVSGAKKIAEREALADLLKYVEENKVDKVLIYECSRLSRRITDFLNVIEFLTERRISLFILQNGLETLQANGSVNPIAQLVMGIISQFNSMERGLIRSRMASGYHHYRQNGGRVGRKVGYRKSEDELRAQYSKEIQLLRKGLSLRNIAAITGTSTGTLQKIKKII